MDHSALPASRGYRCETFGVEREGDSIEKEAGNRKVNRQIKIEKRRFAISNREIFRAYSRKESVIRIGVSEDIVRQHRERIAHNDKRNTTKQFEWRTTCDFH